jgi:hypothetical protein
MKKLALVCVTLGALSQATGCIITTDPDPDPTYGQFAVTWDLFGPGPDSVIVGCGNVGVTARVHSRREGGPDYIDLFDCAVGNGVTAPLLTGTYSVWVDILDANNVLQAQSFAVTNRVLGTNQTPQINFDILRDEAYIEGTWEIVDENTDAPLTCAQVGGTGVEFLVTLSGSTTAYADIFPCEAGEGISDPIPLGTYELDVALLAGEAALTEPVNRQITLRYGQEILDLGHFIFEQ